MQISDIDKNFKVTTNIDKKDVVFKNADENPFEISGVFREKRQVPPYSRECSELTALAKARVRLTTVTRPTLALP